MYIFRTLSLIIIAVGWNFSAIGAEISLGGSKDLVLGSEARSVVLRVGREYLSEKESSFLSQIESVDSPYIFEQPAEVVVAAAEAVQKKVVEINFTESSVLEAIAANFAKQVRGTMARGSDTFLQLNGGAMVKAGTSFPASVPKIKGKTFTVTIAEVTDDGYRLELGDASLTIDLTNGGVEGAAKRD